MSKFFFKNIRIFWYGVILFLANSMENSCFIIFMPAKGNYTTESQRNYYSNLIIISHALFMGTFNKACLLRVEKKIIILQVYAYFKLFLMIVSYIISRSQFHPSYLCNPN